MSTAIFGPSTVSLAQAQAWARSRGAHQRFIDVAPLYWSIAPRYGVAPEGPYGQAAKETDSGHYTGVVGPERHNWCGLKKTTGGDNYDPDAHAVFQTDYDGVLAHILHWARYGGATAPAPGDALLDTRWLAVKWVITTVEEMGGRWAPSLSYGTETATVIDSVRAFARAHPDSGGQMMRRIAVSAGHRNTAGGNAQEQLNTIALTEAFVTLAAGIEGLEVIVLTPDGPDDDTIPGDGTYPGTYNDLAREIVRIHQGGRPIDIAFEWHTEGTGNPNTRGLFLVVPYWTSANDHDTAVDGAFGDALVRAIAAATGLPLRASGVLRPGIMAEYQTGVGGEGSRLGFFANTAAIKGECTRLLIEVGAHTNAADLAIQRGPDFATRAAGAALQQMCAYLGVPYGIPAPQTPPAAEDPNALYVSETGHWIVNQGQFKMLDAWHRFGGLADCGWPLGGMTGEGRTDGGVEQLFGNALIEISADGLARKGGLGQRYERAMQRIHELEARTAA